MPTASRSPLTRSPWTRCRRALLALPLLLLAGCATGLHGGFARTTFYDETLYW